MSPVRWATLGGFFLGALAFAAGVRQGVYVGIISDASAYVAAGDQWRTGELFRPVPMQLWGSWPIEFPGIPAVHGFSPLGFRAGPIRGTEVVGYPPGFPLMIAAATAVFGPLGAFVVAPLTHAVLVWSVFAIARRLAGPSAGLLAAALTASNVLMLHFSVHPMSDVPAAACWIAAWALVGRAGSTAPLASGLLAALAVLIRPALAPLGIVLGGAWLLSSAAVAWSWRRAALFGVVAGVGPGLLAWSQELLYGGWTTSGYIGASPYFSLEHLGPNVDTYPRLFTAVFGWLPFVGVAAMPFASRLAPGTERRLVARTGVVLLLVNLAVHLLYLPYDDALFLRFFFVAIAVITIFFAAVAGRTLEALSTSGSRWRRVAPLLVAAALWPSVRRPDLWPLVTAEQHSRRPIQLMSAYLAEAVPATAVVGCFFHSGTIAASARANVLRLDLVRPDALDAALDALTQGGATPVFVLDEQLEVAEFRRRFASSRYGALDWPPRAEFAGPGTIRYWIVADRERHRRGERWATDVLR